MQYFAHITNNVVDNVIVASQDFINSGAVGDPKEWVETFIDSRNRGNYAGKGFSYDKEKDIFVRKKPFASWSLDEKTAQWKAPKEIPRGVMADKILNWDEKKQEWLEPALINITK